MTESHHTPFIQKTQDLSVESFKKAIGSQGVLMGIDYGSVRIGLALTDPGRNQAAPFKIISKMKELDDIVPAKNVVGFILGMPLQPDNTEGKTACQARLFAERLTEKFHLPILWIDERYSSVATESYLETVCFMRPERRKQVLDAHVAARLLTRALTILKSKKFV